MKLAVKLSVVFLLIAQVESKYRMHWEGRSAPKPDERRCTNDKTAKDGLTGPYPPIAVACEDEIGSENCKRFLMDDPATESMITNWKDTGKRHPLCNNPMFQEAANRCRKTCGTCCEHEKFKGCEDNAKSFKCQSIAEDNPSATPTATVNLCGVKAFKDVFVEACPKSCGYCIEKKLLDAKKKGTSSSGGATKHKKPPIDKEKLKIPRKAHCKDSPPKSAKPGYCERRLYRCEEAKHQKEMDRHCKHTCAQCIPNKFKCKDKEGEEEKCKRWNARNFCLSGDYPLSAKLHHCAATCGMCGGKE